MNIFGTVLTYCAPSCNYRGESAENRTVIQKITDGRFEYAFMSPEALRNALRETLAYLGLPCNRTRLHNKEQLAVRFEDYPDEEKYADDFFFGWLIAATATKRDEIIKKLTEKRGKEKAEKYCFKRDSIIRMNIAKALEPYRHNTIFTQSPLHVESPWTNADTSQLLHREVTLTAFQYPFAFSVRDCAGKPEWARTLLKAIGELNGVSGNQARSYFEMAPASIVIRLTERLVGGFDTYGFRIEEDRLHNEEKRHTFPEVVEGIREGDYPGSEFYLGGKLVKDMDQKTFDALQEKKVTLHRNAQKLLEVVAEKAFPNPNEEQG